MTNDPWLKTSIMAKRGPCQRAKREEGKAPRTLDRETGRTSTMSTGPLRQTRRSRSIPAMSSWWRRRKTPSAGRHYQRKKRQAQTAKLKFPLSQSAMRSVPVLCGQQRAAWRRAIALAVPYSIAVEDAGAGATLRGKTCIIPGIRRPVSERPSNRRCSIRRCTRGG